MREVLDLVERDVASYGPAVRAHWDAFEAALWRDAEDVEREAAAREGAPRGELLGRFSEAAVDRWLVELDAVAAAIRWTHRPGTLRVCAGGGGTPRAPFHATRQPPRRRGPSPRPPLVLCARRP